ncbi:MAG: hypothetical protein ACTHU0_28865 [Kofleriaceae bacterium]
MTARPAIAPDLAAALLAAVPARLLGKLDADPRLAERWQWSATGVTTDKGETVALAIEDGVVSAVTCSCLLQPRCLHIAAVVSLLPPAEPSESANADEGASAGDVASAGKGASAGGVASAGDGESAGEVASAADVASAGSAPSTGASSPTGEAMAPGAAASTGAPPPTRAASGATLAAQRSLRVLSSVLASGAEAAGAFLQAELLRAIHACRTAGLHRLAAAQTRVLRSIRELRADRPEVALSTLAADLRDALAVAQALATGESSPGLVGTARRDYEPIGQLRLRGVLTEAVVARSGYAGATTYLIDDAGALYTRADIAPGDAARARAAYEAPAGLGDAVLPHRELSRGGLFISDATASADGRLGAGQRVRAVRASEPSRWDRDPLAARFAQPLAEQLAAIAAREREPAELRPAGWDLAFVEGVLLGGPGGLALVTGEPAASVALALAMVLDLPALATRDNFVVLARASGLRVRAIGRVRLGAPRRLGLLAIGPAPGETRFALPEAWHGRANVHYDRFSPIQLGDAPSPAVALRPPLPDDDLLAPLRRRVERVVQGGAATLPIHAIDDLYREAAALDERALRHGAATLRDLAALAHDAARSATGVRRALDPDAFARAWLRAALYEDAARRRLSLASW